MDERILRELLSDIMGQLGHALEKKGKSKEALPYFEDLVQSEPTSALAWYNLGDTLLALGRYATAVESLRKAIELAGPGVPLFHYDLGLALHRLGRFEEAVEELRPLAERLDRAQSNLGLAAASTLAVSYGELGNRRQAIETLVPALHLAADLLANLGRFHLLEKSWDEAVRFYGAAAAIAPDSEDVAHGFGSSLMNLGRHEEAGCQLAHATELDPKCADAWYDRGVNLARTKEAKRARNCFEKAIEVKPNHAWAHYDLACLDALAGKKAAAFRNLRKALDLGLDDGKHVLEDPDLKILRGDAEWKEIRSRLP